MGIKGTQTEISIYGHMGRYRDLHIWAYGHKRWTQIEYMGIKGTQTDTEISI